MEEKKTKTVTMYMPVFKAKSYSGKEFLATNCQWYSDKEIYTGAFGVAENKVVGWMTKEVEVSE